MEGDAITRFRESIEISAPPEVVWELISDISRHTEFAGPNSVTKSIEFDGPVAVGTRWIAHEQSGPRKFDAPSEITVVDEGKKLEWVSYPPVKKEEHRGNGGTCTWGYELTPTEDGTRLEHYTTVLEPRKGAIKLKAMFKVAGIPAKILGGVRTTLENIRTAAEQQDVNRDR
ncbi:MAG: SRPBCC family protein [Actinomycetota bacterium]